MELPPFMGHLQEWFAGAASGIFFYGICSSAIRAIPDPDANSGKIYIWFFRFTNGILSNWDKVRATSGPQPQEPPRS